MYNVGRLPVLICTKATCFGWDNLKHLQNCMWTSWHMNCSSSCPFICHNIDCMMLIKKVNLLSNTNWCWHATPFHKWRQPSSWNAYGYQATCMVAYAFDCSVNHDMSCATSVGHRKRQPCVTTKLEDQQFRDGNPNLKTDRQLSWVCAHVLTIYDLLLQCQFNI